MSSYPLPALQVDVPKQESYLDKLEKVQRLRNMAAQNQNMQAQGQLIPGQLKLQQQTIQNNDLTNEAQGMANQSAKVKQQALIDSGGDFDKASQLALQLGDEKAALELFQSKAKMDQDARNLDEGKRKAAAEQISLIDKTAQNVLAAPPEARAQAYAAILPTLRQAGVGPDQAPDQYPGDDFVKLHQVGAIALRKSIADADEAEYKAKGAKADSEIKGYQAEDAGLYGATNGPQADAKYRFLVAQQKLGKQISPENAAFIKAYEQQKSIGARTTFNLNTQAANSLTGDGLDKLAEIAATTGKVPSLGGRGPAAMNTAIKIINRAAELYPNSPFAANAAKYKADVASLVALQKNYDAVTAFENTAKKNLELFIQQASEVVDSGIPFLNTPLREVTQAMGGASYPAYKAALRVANNEIAKVTTNPNLTGVLTNEARNEVKDYNPNNANIEQTLRVAKVLLKDMENRKTSYADKIKETQGRLEGAQPSGGAGPQRIVVTPEDLK